MLQMLKQACLDIHSSQQIAVMSIDVIKLEFILQAQ